MSKQFAIIVTVTAVAVIHCSVFAGQPGLSVERVEIVRYENELSEAWLEPVRRDGKPGIAVVFGGTGDLHYYAKKETAAGGYNLTVSAEAEGVVFAKAEFPQWTIFHDPVLQKLSRP